MTIRRFYENIHGDYEDVMRRMPSEEMVKRFVKRFTTDATYDELAAATESGDISASFEAAHKLKGIAANLAFTELYHAADALAEQLRPLRARADAALLQGVAECYQAILVQHRLYENGGE